jgi:multidrug resistance efflux pump
VALTLALSGCGGGGRLSKGEYERKLDAAGTELSAATHQLASARSKDQFKQAVGDVQRALDGAAHDLGRITPPEDVEAANDRLVDGLRGLAHDFGEVKDAADESIDAATAKAQQVTAGAASREARQAVEEIQRRGYDVGALGTG